MKKPLKITLLAASALALFTALYQAGFKGSPLFIALGLAYAISTVK